MSMDKKNNVVLSCEKICKSFFENQVLKDISFECEKGTVLALIGENGAGKTTLINIISGNLKADSGTTCYSGKRMVMKNAYQAKEQGVAVVHQQLSLIPELSAGENILLGREKDFGRFVINNSKLHEEAQNIVDELQLDIDVKKPVALFAPAERQIVEILKTWIANPTLMILDEPTSSLSITEVKHLFTIIERLKKSGTSIIFISHRLEEVIEICDKVVVLKDGVITKKAFVKDVTKDQLINAMIGRDKNEDIFPVKPTDIPRNTVLEVKNAGQKGSNLKNINLELIYGEILGIAGLEGQGQRAVVRALFGIEPFSCGDVFIKGKRVHINTPSSAMKHGIAFIPDDRDSEGMVKILSVGDNITMATLKDISNGFVINKLERAKSIKTGIDLLNVKAPSDHSEMTYLSGGNQQKVIFSKWLKTRPEILILHEPTRGIDVETKSEIYALMRRLAAQGMSVLVVSSDMIELIGICDRIAVMYEGEIMSVLDGNVADERTIMRLSSGEKGCN